MISVIISTHQGRKNSCSKAIKSVLNQTFQDFEIVVVDDASTDGTDEMVKEFNDPRIVYIKRSENWGNDTKPKNEGILASKGELIAFLDSDNLYRPDHLQALIKAIEKEPKLDGVYGDRFVYVNGEPKGMGVWGEWNPNRLFGENYIDTSDVLIKRECIFDMGGFDESYKKFIDWNLWLRMAKARKVLKHVPLIITDYFINKDSKSLRVEDTTNNKPAWHSLNCKVRLDYLGKKEPPKVAIFSITYDRLDLTKECFKSLQDTADYPYDHFVIDNNSQDGTREWLDGEQREGKIYYYCLNPSNKGISVASNQALDRIGVETRKYDIIIKVDNDCFFKNKGWLKTFVKMWEVWPALTLSLYVEGLKDNPGGAPRVTYDTVAGELVGFTQHVGGICHSCDAGAYSNFRWDEGDFLHGMQDREFTQYLNMNGYFTGYLENWFCEHRLGTEGQHKAYPAYFERRKLEKQTRYETNK